MIRKWSVSRGDFSSTLACEQVRINSACSHPTLGTDTRVLSSSPESRRRERSAQLTDQPRHCHGNQPLNHGKQGRYRSHKSNSRAAKAYEFAALPPLSFEEGGQGKFARVMGGEKAVIFYKSTLSSSWWGERVERRGLGDRCWWPGDRCITLRTRSDMIWTRGETDVELEKMMCHLVKNLI